MGTVVTRSGRVSHVSRARAASLT